MSNDILAIACKYASLRDTPDKDRWARRCRALGFLPSRNKQLLDDLVLMGYAIRDVAHKYDGLMHLKLLNAQQEHFWKHAVLKPGTIVTFRDGRQIVY